MKKILAWIIEKTKVGKVANKVRSAVEGKKQMIVSLATAIAGTLTIVTKFGELGIPYLMELATTPEFLAASAGWMGLFNALKGEKTRAEIKEIKDKAGK